jgi:hypothetical protein
MDSCIVCEKANAKSFIKFNILICSDCIGLVNKTITNLQGDYPIDKVLKAILEVRSILRSQQTA